MSFHGVPIWFEGMVADPDAAQDFYAKVFGWDWGDAGMEGFDYRLARSGADLVAGLMALKDCTEGTPPNWTLYLAARDCDATAAQLRDLGGQVLKAPADIPGTGRFAILADPQGAVFGILTPLPMDPPPPGGAWNPRAPGHGAWIELMTPDPKAALETYRKLFDWRPDMHVDMGPAGGYHVFAHRGAQIGGMMGQGQAPCPTWLPYFGVTSVSKTLEVITAAGGTVLHGPTEVPGPAYVAACRDPQGAHFAVVGPNR
ncbi:VOC family protein [Rhodobacter capsulatus]|uniref:VOC domain-containing protein n=1 Tax=Rhodobacter capsulatus TaxID=1061 RepID=A0A1G7FCT2_RHOCA|nr:VOC family protein [Rhodobacter capsulatus]WER09881.1 VOC family protein [Rhodobacter capsulatus]SDE73731.1 hypothetical protein SAMN04244550_00942 [Rhodobacter capsulatus]